jgi:hypothetical protein
LRASPNNLRNDLNALWLATPELDFDGDVLLTKLQLALLDPESMIPPCRVYTDKTSVNLLMLAGTVCLMIYQEEGFLQQLAQQLLPKLQLLATRTTSLPSRYHEDRVVRMLNCEVVVARYNKLTQGTLQGFSGSPTKIRVLEDTVLEMRVDIASLIDGSVRMEEAYTLVDVPDAA